MLQNNLYFLFTVFLFAGILAATSNEGYGKTKITRLLFKMDANLHFQDLYHVTWNTSVKTTVRTTFEE